jgi:mannose-6-phosphate isomerase-like protein (cupin superfamily)
MRKLLLIALTGCAFLCRAQSLSTDSVGLNSRSDNIYNRALLGDSLSSSFCIVIKKGVKAHKHLHHSEQVIVLEGEGLMKMDGKSFAVKKGDVIFIPKNTVHSVKTTGSVPLKVISVQAPRFDGNDRVFVDEK